MLDAREVDVLGLKPGTVLRMTNALTGVSRLERLEHRLRRLYEDARYREPLEQVYPLRQRNADLPDHLVPVGRALIELGYHDIALDCMELAGELAPTAESQFARAYLLALLGDTEDAYRAYAAAHQRFGVLPPQELQALEVLLSTHPEEEDLAELYELVVKLG
jgi:tetratricopeptide (TPR) repeat protein